MMVSIWKGRQKTFFGANHLKKYNFTFRQMAAAANVSVMMVSIWEGCQKTFLGDCHLKRVKLPYKSSVAINKNNHSLPSAGFKTGSLGSQLTNIIYFVLYAYLTISANHFPQDTMLRQNIMGPVSNDPFYLIRYTKTISSYIYDTSPV